MAEFKYNAPFYGTTLAPGMDAGLSVKFTVTRDFGGPLPSGLSDVPPQEVAAKLNELLAAHGWGPVQFYGTPEDVPLS